MQVIHMIKVLVVDSHEIVGSGVSAILGGYSDLHVVGQVHSGEAALRFFERYQPDLISIDIDLPGPITGMEVIYILHQKYPHTRHGDSY